MHKWIGLLAAEAGIGVPSMHFDVRDAYLPKVSRINGVTGQQVTEPLSINALDLEQIEEFLAKLYDLGKKRYGIDLIQESSPLARRRDAMRAAS